MFNSRFLIALRNTMCQLMALFPGAQNILYLAYTKLLGFFNIGKTAKLFVIMTLLYVP